MTFRNLPNQGGKWVARDRGAFVRPDDVWTRLVRDLRKSESPQQRPHSAEQQHTLVRVVRF